MEFQVGDRVKAYKDRVAGRVGTVGIVLDDGIIVVDLGPSTSESYLPEELTLVRRRP